MWDLRTQVGRRLRYIHFRRAIIAAALGLALFCGVLTPAIRLAQPDRVDCGMECCLEEGVCCCLAGQSWERADGVLVFSGTALSRGCPSHCASTPSASPVVSFKAERPKAWAFIVARTRNRPHELRERTIAPFIFFDSPPRGPPLLLSA